MNQVIDMAFRGSVTWNSRWLSIICVVPPKAKNRCFIYHGNKDIVVKGLNDTVVIAFRRVRIFLC